MISAEQQARDLLESYGVKDAQALSAGDVVELANLIADAAAYRRCDRVTVVLLNPNQCGICRHWSWEHQGPQHPCNECGVCDKFKPPDPDRTDENVPEPC